MTMKKESALLTGTVVALAIITGILLYYSAAVFFQLFIAFALAYILDPAVDRLERLGVGRIPSILIVFTLSLLFLTGFSWFLIVSVGSEFSRMQLNIPGYAQHLYEITPVSIKSYLNIETPEKLSLRLNEAFEQLRTAAPAMLKPALNFLRQAFSSTVSLILIILGYLIIPVYLFYLLVDLQRLKIFIISFVPPRYHAAYEEKMSEVDMVLSGFIRGQLLVCAILAVLYSIGLYLIGIDLAIAIGTLAGITFIIPYVGTILGIIFSVIMAVLKFQDFLHPLLCVGWFAVVQGLEGSIITPKIVGNKVGLHPLVALIALLIGGQIFGLSGMLLAVPVTAVLQVFLRTLSAHYRGTGFYRGSC